MNRRRLLETLGLGTVAASTAGCVEFIRQQASRFDGRPDSTEPRTRTDQSPSPLRRAVAESTPYPTPAPPALATFEYQEVAAEFRSGLIRRVRARPADSITGDRIALVPGDRSLPDVATLLRAAHGVGTTTTETTTINEIEVRFRGGRHGSVATLVGEYAHPETRQLLVARATSIDDAKSLATDWTLSVS